MINKTRRQKLQNVFVVLKQLTFDVVTINYVLRGISQRETTKLTTTKKIFDAKYLLRNMLPK